MLNTVPPRKWDDPVTPSTRRGRPARIVLGDPMLPETVKVLPEPGELAA
jgi:hypothetical protein